ncbi:MAG: hypothetical protein H7099_06760, partial [Gemmatimonadaceae bacterium]|nr:hypothetical protein [Gemmatimonadaceae bacterium]
MTMSRLADLYLHVGRTFEIASEQRTFDDVLQHFAQLADDALLLTRIGRSATLSLHSRHFSCVWFSLARHDASPDQDVRAA